MDVDELASTTADVGGMDLKTIVANTAIVCTIGSFLTGAPICLKIWRKGSTADFSAFPFIAGVLCTALWLRYGLFIYDNTVIFVNTIGLICQVSYLLWYYAFTLNKTSICRQLLILTLSLSAVLLYLVWVTEDAAEATRVSGLLACGASLIFCGSPLASLAEVVKAKSVETLPFPLILSSFFVTSLWYIYGLLVADAFIQVPNFIGALISGFQLFLFALYPSKKPPAVVS